MLLCSLHQPLTGSELQERTTVPLIPALARCPESAPLHLYVHGLHAGRARNLLPEALCALTAAWSDSERGSSPAMDREATGG
jgi:hypothetical protein